MTYLPRIKRRPTGHERNIHEHVAATVGSCHSHRWDWTPKGQPKPITEQLTRRQRIAVLRQRIDDGVELFHHDDNTEIDWEDFDADFDND